VTQLPRLVGGVLLQPTHGVDDITMSEDEMLEAIKDSHFPSTFEMEVEPSDRKQQLMELCLDSLSIGGVTSDNVANYGLALTNSGFPIASCIGHTLGLSLNDVLGTNQASAQWFTAIKAARNLVKYDSDNDNDCFYYHYHFCCSRFRNEHLLADCLTALQQEKKQPTRRLHLDVATRFNSIVTMLERLVLEMDNMDQVLIRED
jgi:hypothetical protein